MRQRQLHRSLSLLAVVHVEQLADSLLFEKGSGEVSSFDGHISQHPLLIGFFQDVLLHCALTDQSVDVDVPGLSDAVAAVLSLGVHGGIPVAVVEDHGVCAGQVDAHASTASGQDEAEDASVCVESLHEGLSLFHAGAAVQTEVDVSVVVEELLQHIQHASHLSEDEHAVTTGLQLPQQRVESLKLPAVVLNQPQVRELRPHVTLDPMKAAGERRRLCGQRGSEDSLLVAQRRRRVAAVHGDRRSLHRGDHKREPVDDVRQQFQAVLHAMDGASDGSALLPQVQLVLRLSQQAAAVARAAPVRLGSQKGWRGPRAGQEGEEVQNLAAIQRPGAAATLVHPEDEVQPALPLLLQAVRQPRHVERRAWRWTGNSPGRGAGFHSDTGPGLRGDGGLTAAAVPRH